MLATYGLAAYFAPGMELLVLLLIGLVSPVLIVKAKAFRLGNSSYRGVRFFFAKDYGGAFKAIYLGALLAGITLGLAYPAAAHMRNRFVLTRSHYGTSPFEYSGQAGDFFKIYYLGYLYTFLIAVALVIAVLFPLAGLLVVDGTSADELSNESIAVTLLLYAVVGLFAYVWVAVKVTNHNYDHLRLRDCVFRCDLEVGAMYWIYLTNALVILASLGFAIPWAKVRLARYRADHLQMRLPDDWGEFTASDRQRDGALGQEVGDAFDVDIGFGV